MDSMLMFKCLEGLAPAYLVAFCTRGSAVSGRSALRSAVRSASHLKTVGDSEIDRAGRVRRSNQSPNSIGLMRDRFD